MRKVTQVASRLFKFIAVALVLWGILILVAACSQENAKSQGAEKESTRSAPPDTTPYVRKTVPEDYAPGGKKAIPPEVTPMPPAPGLTLPEKGPSPGKKEPNKEN